MYPENDYRNYLMHASGRKSHKYISRKMGSSGKWVYTYAKDSVKGAYHTPGWNSKEDGVHRRVPKSIANQFENSDSREKENSDYRMARAKQLADDTMTELIRARRSRLYEPTAELAEKEYKKRLKEVKKKKRKEKIRKFLSNFGL